jgi:hypothetical protein
LASGNIVGFLHADDVYAHNKLYWNCCLSWQNIS